MSPSASHVPVPHAVLGRRVSVLGSTGSVGENTLDLIRHYRRAEPGAFPVAALTAHRQSDKLIAQAREFRPAVVAIHDIAGARAVEAALAGSGVRVLAGPDGIVEAAREPADWTMAAIVGAAGLAPTLAAIDRGNIVAIANKECLVCAGDIVRRHASRSEAVLLPVDSEHNAVFQCFEERSRAMIERVILTASGGPFRTWTKDAIAAATPEQACLHPNWSMGAKISVDSATLMNKGLELIEARVLFGLSPDQLEVVVHPQSIIHSLVGYGDGSVLAQLGPPDMRTSIAYALGWPHRIVAPTPRLDLVAIASLTFEAPDEGRFPCLGLAKAAMRAGGLAPAFLNAANEVAVDAFLSRTAAFWAIPAVVEKALARCQSGQEPTALDDVLAADGEARQCAREVLAGLGAPVAAH